jgi:hypothetical protein
VATSEIPALIIEYIAACAQIPLSSRDLAGYDDSGTRRRHLPLIREALDLQPYGPPARKAFLRAMVEAARTKDDLADLINVALEELVRVSGHLYLCISRMELEIILGSRHFFPAHSPLRR